jgi:hypothetical protein
LGETPEELKIHILRYELLRNKAVTHWYLGTQRYGTIISIGHLRLVSMKRLATEIFYGENTVALELLRAPDAYCELQFFVPPPALTCWIRNLTLHMDILNRELDITALNSTLGGWRNLLRKPGRLSDTAWQQHFPRLQDLTIVMVERACLTAEERDWFNRLSDDATIELRPKRLELTFPRCLSCRSGFEHVRCQCWERCRCVLDRGESVECKTFIGNILRRKMQL